jgi:aminopeptidase N
MKRLMFYSLILFVTVSCSLLGINKNRTAPKKAGKYPEFTLKDSLKGYLFPERTCFDVTYYNLDITFDIEEKFIKGKVDIHFLALTDFDSIQLDLYENMKINKVIYEGQSLSYNRVYDAFYVKFKETIPKNTQKMLTVYYEGHPKKAKKAPWDGGTVWKKDQSGHPFCGVACELDGASLWWPLKDHLSDEPDSAQMSFTVPQGLFCVSNGWLAERRIREAGTETFTWKVSNPINTYNITYYIGNYRAFEKPYVRKDTMFNLTFYVLPEHLNVAKSHFNQTKSMMAFYENTFGDYDWFNDGYKLVESPYAGMEHQTAIAYGQKYKNNYNGFDYIILHETAHEWWGNSVSVSDFADIWLHEGFATYSEALYVEHTKDHLAYLQYLYFYSITIKNKLPMVGPRHVKYWNYKDGDPYTKGALTLHSLRSTIDNDSVFFDIIKSFHTENIKGIVNSDTFIELVNIKTGQNYDWFFYQFLYNRKPPKFVYSLVYSAEKKAVLLYYKWVDVGIDFRMPIDTYFGDQLTRVFPTTSIKEIALPDNVDAFKVDKLNFYFTFEELKYEDLLKL